MAATLKVEVSMRPKPASPPSPPPTPPTESASAQAITWRFGKPKGLDQPIEMSGSLSELVLEGRR